MPPHGTNKRFKASVTVAKSVPRTNTKQEPPAHRKAAILEMPLELWGEILSHFPAMPIPYLRPMWANPVLPPRALNRADVLKALSQTCRCLREMYLKKFWERFEVCAIRTQKDSGVARPNLAAFDKNMLDLEVDDPLADHGRLTPGSWYLDVAKSVQMKSKWLIQNPGHATLVQIVNVILTRCTPEEVLPSFARCLEALPNAHTLQVLRAHPQMTTHLKNAFEERSFPAIRTVILPSHAHNILRCCKKARVVICNFGDGSKLISAIAKECKNVERLEGILPDANLLKRVVKAAPKLRTIKVWEPADPEVLHILSGLKELGTVEIQTRIVDKRAITTNAHLAACIRVARDVLRNSPCEKKSLTVRYEDYTPTTIQSWTRKIDVI